MTDHFTQALHVRLVCRGKHARDCYRQCASTLLHPCSRGLAERKAPKSGNPKKNTLINSHNLSTITTPGIPCASDSPVVGSDSWIIKQTKNKARDPFLHPIRCCSPFISSVRGFKMCYSLLFFLCLVHSKATLCSRPNRSRLFYDDNDDHDDDGGDHADDDVLLVDDDDYRTSGIGR